MGEATSQKGARQGLRDLFLGLGFICLLSALTAWGVWCLECDAKAVDRLPIVHYEQPAWSQDESRVAFFRLFVEPNTLLPLSDRKELWWASRVGQESQLLASVSTAYRILGWADEDRLILLQEEVADEELPRLMQVDATTGEPVVVSFQRAGIRLVGVKAGLAVFQKLVEDLPWEVAASDSGPELEEPGVPEEPFFGPLWEDSEPKLTRKGIEISLWAPGLQRFETVVTIPFTDRDPLTVQDVFPSPDHRFFAITLQIGDDQGVALWIYDREQERLLWSKIRCAQGPLEVAWSPDSVGLVASAGSHQGTELFVLRNVLEGSPTRLASGESEVHYRPFWPRRDPDFLLLGKEEVLRFDPQTRQAEPVLSGRSLGAVGHSVRVSPRGSWGAFSAPFGEGEQLYVVSLRTRKRKALLPPSERLRRRARLSYQLADSLRWAVSYWREGSRLAIGE